MPDQNLLDKVLEDCTRKRAELMESFVLVYLRDTGLRIDEVEMVERSEGFKIAWYLRKKGSAD